MLLSLFRAHAVEGQGAQVKEYAADIRELPVNDPAVVFSIKENVVRPEITMDDEIPG